MKTIEQMIYEEVKKQLQENSELMLFNTLIKELKREGIKYELKRKMIGQPRVVLSNGIVISSGDVFYDKWTIFKNTKELNSYSDITKLIDYIQKR